MSGRAALNAADKPRRTARSDATSGYRGRTQRRPAHGRRRRRKSCRRNLRSRVAVSTREARGRPPESAREGDRPIVRGTRGSPAGRTRGRRLPATGPELLRGLRCDRFEAPMQRQPRGSGSRRASRHLRPDPRHRQRGLAARRRASGRRAPRRFRGRACGVPRSQGSLAAANWPARRRRRRRPLLPASSSTRPARRA